MAKLSNILSKIDDSSHLINRSLKNSKINYISILKLIFEYYKIEKQKSNKQIIESWLNIVKVHNTSALRFFTDTIVTERIALENFIEIVKKITNNLTIIELQNDSVFLYEIFYSYLTILNKCYELDADFNVDSITQITKISNNKLPEKLYDFYFNNYDNRNENLNKLVKSIANG